jgi:peptidoglycan/xylan/chitin deacetylase (PgdA/CDA1 family)
MPDSQVMPRRDPGAAAAAPALAYPAPRIGSAPGWPLVVYFHHVRSDIDHYTVVSADEFAFALDLLGERFGRFDPRAVETAVHSGPPSRPECLVTFDDGYRDVYEEALPVLEERGWRALFFVSSEQVGTVERHPVRGRLDHMTWDELRELRERGHEIASHGASHRDMSALASDEARRDIQLARATLADLLPGAPDWLAFPYGNPPRDPLTWESRVCFGSVKAAPLPWSERTRAIRRTYLPAGEVETWPEHVTGWWCQCSGLASL